MPLFGRPRVDSRWKNLGIHELFKWIDIILYPIYTIVDLFRFEGVCMVNSFEWY